MIREPDVVIMDITLTRKPHLTGLAGRIKRAVERRGLQKDVAALAEIPPRSLGNWIAGANEPPATSLAKIANVCGVTVDWLLNGPDEGDGNADTDTKYGDTRFGAKATAALDGELFGRLIDAIQSLYKDEHVRLAPIDLGRIAASKYDEITAATADPAERGAMIKLIVTQLRAEIRSARAEPGTGKASA